MHWNMLTTRAPSRAQRSLRYGLLSTGAALMWFAHMAWTGLFGFGAFDLLLLLVSLVSAVMGVSLGARGLFNTREPERLQAVVGTITSLAGPAIFITTVLVALSSFELPLL
jgi:hypothetical protein